MELRDTNPPGRVTQKYETEGGTSVRDEWRDEWKMIHETMNGNGIFQFQPLIVWGVLQISCISVGGVLTDNTFSLTAPTDLKECCPSEYPSVQLPQIQSLMERRRERASLSLIN